ncbi:hypothetical protein HPB47_009301 [Ixodes persulcatus]|uniref:Uncharacterized protein n=1 Tax=Ixodes persulcatus TaxID=34615 RepID=A0AC60P2H9_IXOPE|nr:hypothetical protein HPB47_009301 [Ixodes persulcatus]
MAPGTRSFLEWSLDLSKNELVAGAILSANGIGLLVATIESFLQDSDLCPHVILATHFHLLHDILPSSPLLSHQTFASLHHQGEMVYLYQLIEGHARGSCAGLVALSANVARDVVQRQQQIVRSRSANSSIGVLRLERKQHDWTEHLQGPILRSPQDFRPHPHTPGCSTRP